MKPTNYLINLSMVFLFCSNSLAQSIQQILKKVDDHRRLSESFSMKINLTDFKDNRLREEAEFYGHFKGNKKSLLLCTKGRNKGMKVLMKGDHMWVSLRGSRRALRITPMQRLMGQASNGDLAKVSFSEDYTGKILERSNPEMKIHLTAKRKGATYQSIILTVDSKTYMPLKADFFLLSGKHFKTAIYKDYMEINGRRVVKKIRIEDVIKKGAYTVMEFLNYRSRMVPEKYFNVMYLPKLELD